MSPCPQYKSPRFFTVGFLKFLWRRPTLPGTDVPSTIGSGGLNCRVRDGNGCTPSDIDTRKLFCHCLFVRLKSHLQSGDTPSKTRCVTPARSFKTGQHIRTRSRLLSSSLVLSDFRYPTSDD